MGSRMIAVDSLNRKIWILAASLFVVFALYAGYKVFIQDHQTIQDKSCQHTDSSDELTVDNAACIGAGR
jgi:hypothetical protein